jgi:mono/diheme cytochrome c family protein
MWQAAFSSKSVSKKDPRLAASRLPVDESDLAEQLPGLEIHPDLNCEACLAPEPIVRGHGMEPTTVPHSFSRTRPRHRGSVPAVLLTVTTTGKVTLLIVAGAFIGWALITAIWIPKRNPDFPVTLTAFVLVSSLFFLAQMGAVYWVTTTQEVEKEAVESGGGGETTPAETTPTETTPATGGEGDAAAGKEVFASAGCTGCHTLADAGSNGNVGPNLDEAKPSSDLVITRVTNGQGAMPPFKGQLSEQQIKDVAAYVSSVAGG